MQSFKQKSTKHSLYTTARNSKIPGSGRVREVEYTDTAQTFLDGLEGCVRRLADEVPEECCVFSAHQWVQRQTASAAVVS